jgi:hypothetical protein
MQFFTGEAMHGKSIKGSREHVVPVEIWIEPQQLSASETNKQRKTFSGHHTHVV